MKKILLCFLFPVIASATTQNFTVISEKDYRHAVAVSRAEIQNTFPRLNAIKKHYKNKDDLYTAELIYLAKTFEGVPYNADGAEGEGDWQPSSTEYQPGAEHIQEDPVYRTDQFDCQTLVEVFLALLHSNNLDTFDPAILKIEYGIAGKNAGVHYYNRNNFVDADFNPVNEQNGLMHDATRQGIWRNIAKTTSAWVDRNAWFHHQTRTNFLKCNVRVLSEKHGPAMAARLQNHYPQPFVSFKPKRVYLTYIPKEALVIKMEQPDGTIFYKPNEKLINQLPVPSVVEIVRDVHTWKLGNKSIQEAIGTQMSVSHLGLLYRENFKQGDVMARNVSCEFSFERKKCRVIPHYCTHKICVETIMLQATDAYPDSFFYYGKQGHFYCTATAPKGANATTCNRVVSMPIGDYLTHVQYNKNTIMDEPSILGIHLEQLN